MTKIIGIVAAALAFTACNIGSVEGQAEWMHTYSLAQGGTMQMDNTNGRIEIEPSDGSDVEVHALKIAHAATEAAAKEAANAVQIRETATTDRITIETGETGKSFFSSSPEVRFHVKAPKWARLKISSTNGEIDLRDMTGDVSLETTNGRIHAVGLEGTTDARTTNGEINLDFAKSPPRGIECSATNGEVVVAIPKDTRGHIAASLTHGGISVDNLTLTTSNRSDSHVEGDINGGGPSVKIETTNGRIKIRGK